MSTDKRVFNCDPIYLTNVPAKPISNIPTITVNCIIDIVICRLFYKL